MPQCEGKTKSGSRCKNNGRGNSGYCHVHAGSRQAAGTQSADLSLETRELQRRLNKLESRLDANATKDAWDKFDLIGKFVAGVLLVAIGGVFTFTYNSSQKNQDRRLTVERQQTYKLETVSKFMPYIAHEKERLRQTAILIVQRLVGTETATQLAVLRVGPETPTTLVELRGRAEGAGAATVEQALQRVVSTGPFSVLKIYFATTRARIDPAGTDFGRERAEPSYGTASVSIAREHEFETIEQPTISRLEPNKSKGRHVTIATQNTMPADDFFDLLEKEQQGKDKADFLVYVHGFNVTFSQAVKRLGQFANDIAYEGTPILYSWPSAASPLSYFRDQATVTWSVSSFESFLEELLEKFPKSNVRLVGSTLGAVVVLKALFAVGNKLERAPFINHIVLIRPDIDAELFRDVYVEKVTKYARRVTLYSYPNDPGLRVAGLMRGRPRAGGAPVVVEPGVDTIAVTESKGTMWIGSLLNDLHSLLVKELPPEKRSNLTSVSRGPGAYWELK